MGEYGRCGLPGQLALTRTARFLALASLTRMCLPRLARPQMQAFARLASDHLWLCDRDDE